MTGRSLDLEPGSLPFAPRGFPADGNRNFSASVNLPPLEAGKAAIALCRQGPDVPSYPGTIEVANMGGNLVIVNEVPLDGILCYVLPGECPSPLVRRPWPFRPWWPGLTLGNLYFPVESHFCPVVDSVLSQVTITRTTAAARPVESHQGQSSPGRQAGAGAVFSTRERVYCQLP